MKHDQKTLDSFIENMVSFTKDVADEDRVAFASDLLFSATLYLSYNHVESIGILECVKKDLQDSFENCVCEECKKEEEAKSTVIKKDKKLFN